MRENANWAGEFHQWVQTEQLAQYGGSSGQGLVESEQRQLDLRQQRPVEGVEAVTVAASEDELLLRLTRRALVHSHEHSLVGHTVHQALGVLIPALSLWPLPSAGGRHLRQKLHVLRYGFFCNKISIRGEIVKLFSKNLLSFMPAKMSLHNCRQKLVES